MSALRGMEGYSAPPNAALQRSRRRPLVQDRDAVMGYDRDAAQNKRAALGGKRPSRRAAPRGGEPIRNTRWPQARFADQPGRDRDRFGASRWYLMSIRAAALTGILQHELTRLGRPSVAITLGTDGRSVTLADNDGRWQGPLPTAYGALVVCGSDEARTGQFWHCFARTANVFSA